MDGIKMKSNALSKFTPDWRAAAILLALAGTSNVRAIPIKHRPYHILAGRKDIPLQLVVHQKNQTEGWYQPPRSPGFNEDLGG
jgi:hypothetical protein